MKRFTPHFFTALFSIVFLTSCLDDEPGLGNGERFRGSGVIITETRELPDFNAITSSPAIDLTITQGAIQAMEVSSDDNLIDRVITRVNMNGQLIIDLEEGSYENLTLRVNIVIPELISVENLGAGRISIEGFNDQETLTLRNTGAASFDLSGSANELIIELLGAGNIAAFDFAANTVRITLTGSGNIEVSAAELIAGNILGAGNIHYRGEPTIDVNITGAGAVVNAN
ncbi:MAG: head GIN domain-containing protein [Cytophagales bacterium]|nr:head GIN domain-containing protein [Cytophagales bacterium]